MNDLWIAFELQKPTKLDALRYLPRPAGSKNGSVTEYKVQVSDDGTNWTDAGSGTWTTDYGWKLAEFNQPVTTKHVRLKAVHTYADSGNDKFMSASEIRLRKAVDTTDISGATVTVPAKLTVDRGGRRPSRHLRHEGRDGDVGRRHAALRRGLPAPTTPATPPSAMPR